MGHSKSKPEREVHSITDLLQEDVKISNKQSNPTLKELEKQQQTKCRVRGKKEIIKIRVEINNTESKKQ